MIIILLQHRHMIWGVLTLIGGICYHVDDWVMFVSLRHLVWVSSYSLFNLKWYISIVEISFLLICTCVSFLGKSICRWLFVWIWIFMVDKIHLWIIFFSFSNFYSLVRFSCINLFYIVLIESNTFKPFKCKVSNLYKIRYVSWFITSYSMHYGSKRYLDFVSYLFLKCNFWYFLKLCKDSCFISNEESDP